MKLKNIELQNEIKLLKEEIKLLKKIKTKSRANVGILYSQKEKIAKLVENGKYSSINMFVIIAVNEKLKGSKK